MSIMLGAKSADPNDRQNASPIAFETALQCGWPAKVTLISKDIATLDYTLPSVKKGEADKVHRFTTRIKDQEEIEKVLKDTIKQQKNGPVVVHAGQVRMNALCEDRTSTHHFTTAGVQHMFDVIVDEGELAFWREWYKGGFDRVDSKLSDAQVAGQEGAAYTMSSVFDGCGGFHMAELANRVWHCGLVYAVAQAAKSDGQDVQEVLIKAVEGMSDLLIAAIFTRLGVWPKRDYPFLPPGIDLQLDQGALYSMNRASTMATVMVDHKSKTLYAVNMGDSRIVAGWWRPKDGVWECDTLTEDHTPGNPSEAARIRANHPERDPAEMVYARRKHIGDELFGIASHSRVLGGHLQVHGAAILEPVCNAIGDYVDPVYDGVDTSRPPYNIPTPGLTTRALEQLDRELKFVILATDGFWDRVTSEEAVLLTAAHLAHPEHPDIPKADLPAAFLLDPKADLHARPYPAKALPGIKGRDKGFWTFKDHDAATHLIRNSQGDGDDQLRRVILSMPPECRQIRDDTTVK